MNLTEAFQALDKLDEEVFSVTDTDLSKLQDFMTSDDSIDEVDIFNLDAECDCEEESHEGETVLDCCVCHSKLLKPVEEVIVDEESELVNKGEECPYCFSTEGYKVVGEIKSVEDNTIESDDDADDDTEIDECTDAPVITEDVDSDFEDAKEMWEMEDPDFDLEEYIDDFYTKAVKELSKKYKDLEVEPSIQSGRGTVFASYTRNDGKNVRAEWSYEDEVDSLEGAFLDATSADEFFAAVKSFIEENLKNAVAVEESLKESAKVDLLTKDNTIASVLKDNMDKLYSITNPNELRNAIIEIVDASNIADKPAVQKLKRDLFSKKSVSALLSTIATYMTGDKVIKTNRRGKMTEDVADNLGTDLDKYQKWVDYDMKKYHKISDKTNNEIRKAGLQVVKDKYGDYQVIAGKYDGSLKENESKSIKESVKDVTITTDDSRTTMTSEDNGKVSVTTEPIETSDETDEIIAPVSEETEREIEINSIDKDTIEEVTEKCLKENFNNVTFFRTNNVTRNTNAFVVEGVIGLKSGKKHNTRFLFESSMTDNSKVSFSGKNRTLKNKSLSLIGTVDKNNKLISESLIISNASNDVKGE